jgi:hypothetical protein
MSEPSEPTPRAPVPPVPGTPAAAPAPAPAKAAPPPVAPGFMELLEAAVAGVFNPAVYVGLAARPAPSIATTAGLAAASGAASLVVNLAHSVVETPGFLGRYSPLLMGAVTVAALGMYGSVTLLLAVMMYGLGNALGGKGEFDRGLQCAAMMSILWPVQMMCNWFPVAWVLPSALAAWIAAIALVGLFGAKPILSRTVCAILGAGALAIQTVAHVVADKAAEAISATQAVTQATEAQADFAKQMQAVQTQMQAVTDATAASAAPSGALPGARPATSGLDLLRGPGGEDGGTQAPAPEAPPAVIEAAKGMQANAAGMLDSISPLLNNPAMTKNMTPDQKANLVELQTLMADLKAQMASGHSVSDAAFAQKMQRFQALTLKMMSAAASAPPAPAAAPVKATPHLVLPDESKK